MFDFLDKLRKKPINTRQTIAFGISITITAIIFGIWLFNLIWNLNHPPADQGPGPIESIVSGIGEGIQNLPNPLATTTLEQ